MATFNGLMHFFIAWTLLFYSSDMTRRKGNSALHALCIGIFVTISMSMDNKSSGINKMSNISISMSVRMTKH